MTRNFILLMTAVLISISVVHAKPPKPQPETKEQRQSAVMKLKNMYGKFVYDGVLKTFTYDKSSEMEQALDGFDKEQLLTELIRCMGDITPSNSRYLGEPVRTAIVCNSGIKTFAYHDKNPWPGDLTPESTVPEIRKAKKAWEAVLKNKTYRLL